MNFIYRFALMLCLLGISISGMAQDNTTDATDTIIEAINLEKQLYSHPEELQRLFDQNPFRLSSSKNEQLRKLFKEEFSKQFLFTDARNTFQNKYHPEYADTTLQWMAHASIQSVLNAEKNYYTLQGIRKQVVHKYELEQNPPSQDRKSIIKQMVRNLSIAERHIESKVIIFRAIISAFSEISSKRSFSEAQLEGIVANYRGQLQSQIDQQIEQQFLVKYYEVEDQHLQTFSAFFDTDAGDWLSNTRTEAMLTAYQSAADRFLKSIRNL